MVKEFCPNFNFCQKWVWSCHAPQGDQNFLGLFSIFLDNKLHDTKELKIENIPFRTRPEFRFRSGTGSGGIWAGTDRFGRYQTGTQFFSCWIIGFLFFALMSHLLHLPPPVPWLDHVHPPLSSSQTVSRAPLHSPVPRLDHVHPSTLQFPDWITCTPPLSSSQTGSRAPLHSPVPWLDQVLPSSSQNLSRTAISPLAILGEVNYLYFHRLLLLLISHQAPTFPNNYTTKLICHKFYTLT